MGAIPFMGRWMGNEIYPKGTTLMNKMRLQVKILPQTGGRRYLNVPNFAF